MWYHLRYAYNLLLTAFQIVGLVLLGLGTATAVLMMIGFLFSVSQKLLGYELLLTRDIVDQSIAFGIGSCLLGGILTLLGLSATDPKFLKKQGI